MRKKYSVQELKDAQDEIRKNLMTVKDTDPSELIKNPAFYIANKVYINRLMNWLKKSENSLNNLDFVSINERSFQIFYDEKFLEGNSFQRDEERKTNSLIVKSATSLLKKCGVSKDRLMYYETTEAIAYHIFDYSILNQNLLIIENEDTYVSARKCFHKPFYINGELFTGIVYGRGKGVLGSFKNYKESFPNGLFDTIHFSYFGDLDYEGIQIYKKLNEIVDSTEICLCTFLYEEMLKKSKCIEIQNLPNTKENQSCNEVYLNEFLNNFDIDAQDKILEILEMRKYIPQEILDFTYFKKIKKSSIRRTI